ncbi:hypothetical protein [Arthrobacter sp. EpRS71]|uniref:hypothetical protein n=1 Tax=Arthrobacter sp. EpRS71 TaxID=1743141 RepID=UPI00074668A4|nr:hypothetical protein [Arthrobacter sp. EpRS71]KUM34574.1 hypothetical protein AR689_10560 [Arthrobacter sp. EpRS71]
MSLKATVRPVGRKFLAWCDFHQEGERHRSSIKALKWVDAHNNEHHRICDVCEVDHSTTMADLSHGIIRLMQHAQERMTWMEYPVNGDMIARQRAGIVGKSLLYSTTDPEDIDWQAVALLYPTSG